MPNTVAVAAALICQGGRFLIGQRPAHKARGLLWEFVGGKLEPGETGPEALSRECREELGVTVAVGPLYARLTHTYPDLTVELLLYQAAIAAGTPQLLEHADLDTPFGEHCLRTVSQAAADWLEGYDLTGIR